MDGTCISIVSPDDSRRALLYDAVILVPNVLFISFLLFHLRRSIETLTRQQSKIMSTYYGLVWAVCICNFLRAGIQLLGSSTHDMATWNLMWLFTRFMMIMLEVSVVVFLLHGYVSSSSTALTRTLVISTVIAAVDAAVKMFYIFVLHVPLYTYAGDDPESGDTGVEGDMAWSKWGFWLVHTVLFTLVYAGLVLLPLTQWRDLLPARDTFHRYVRVLFTINLISAIGASLIGSHLGWGYCVYGLSSFAYYACYPPLLYVTFLSSFFKSDDIDLDNYYYSEMSEAGYFEGGDDTEGPLFQM